MFTDTDSLCYENKTEDFYEDISEVAKDKFDTTNFPEDHSSGIPTGLNKKVIGMMKDECGGKIMREFVGLRPKLYIFKMHEGQEQKRCKGVKQSVVKDEITFKHYKACLDTQKEQIGKMNVIRSHRHEVYSEEVNKVAFKCKR